MVENLTLEQFHQDSAPRKEPSVVTALCSDQACRHEWIVAYLPMQLDKVARLMTVAVCPKCANERPMVAHD